MKNKSAATIITKALKATDDEEVKQKLRDKLVQLALNLDLYALCSSVELVSDVMSYV